MSLFKHIFGASYHQLKAKVRYRLLLLTLLPILLTLISLVFITIYWNISYTGNQLFMKVKGDLSVAINTLKADQHRQEQELENVVNSYLFHTRFSSLFNGVETQPQALNASLTLRRDQFNLDFLRLVNIAQIKADPNLSLMLQKIDNNAPYSGLMVLTEPQLAQINPALAEKARIQLVATQRAEIPHKKYETNGLISRTLLPIPNANGEVVWYLDGGILFNHNTHIVDTIRDLVYDQGTLPEHSIGTVTVFLDNVRISTNVPLHFYPKQGQERGRALGSLVSDNVRNKVLKQGEIWVDRAFVFDDWFVSAYAPLTDIYGQRIGMVYTGFSELPFVHNYLLNLVELGTILILVLLVSGLLVYRGAYSLLQPIERIHYVVKAVQSGQDVRIGALGLERDNELTHLAEQFDRMLDQLQQRNTEIQLAAEQLEMKVEQRTLSLQQKTRELQRNMQLLNETRQQMIINEKLTALGELTAGIAHEINNPTAVILGNMELLKYELGDNAAVVQEEIDLIIQQVGRISTIIRSLLQYSRPGEFNAPLEMHQVNPIIEEMLILVRHSIKRQEVMLLTELNASQPVQINKLQLQQVLINLVINAAHATQGKGRIWIRSRDWYQDNNTDNVIIGVQIEVEDEGNGISEAQLGRIFDPFFTTRTDGTGLGLSLSYGIIKRIGGTIEVDSTEGEGTIFTIGLYHQAKESNDGVYPSDFKIALNSVS